MPNLKIVLRHANHHITVKNFTYNTIEFGSGLEARRRLTGSECF